MDLAEFPLRPVRLGSTSARATRHADGSTLLRLEEELGPYPVNLTDRLVRWAAERPGDVFLSMREEGGQLRSLTYAETLARVEEVGAALLARRLPPGRPVAILSENGIENALLVLAALHVGIPYVPVSPPYSLLATGYVKLRGVLDLVRPALVFAEDGARYGRAIRAAAPPDAEVVTVRNHLTDPASTPFDALLGHPDPAAVARAHAAVTPGTVAKVMFTSGTTGAPKGVVFPHRMLSSQRQQVAQTLAFTIDEPVHLVDWLSWHHTFGGTNNFGIVLYSGGSLRIDTGRPTPELVGPTVQNLREVAPTLYLNTPSGFATLLPYFRREPALRQTFFTRLKLIYYGGATLPLHIWDELDRLAVETVGERILITSGIGCTEAGPTPASANWDPRRTALAGLPVPGVEIKVAPVQDKLELRFKGPCVMPGYFGAPDLTRAAFDEDGFYRTGDAVRFIDPERPGKGLRFDGRLAENFKLATGTWVHVSELRGRAIAALAPCAADAVVTAPDRPYLGLIVFPDMDACRKLSGAGPDVADAAVVAAPAVLDTLRRGLRTLAQEGSGVSSRPLRLVVAVEPATLDNGELTDKRSVSQGAVLGRRAALAARLYAEPPEPDVLAERA